MKDEPRAGNVEHPKGTLPSPGHCLSPAGVKVPLSSWSWAWVLKNLCPCPCPVSYPISTVQRESAFEGLIDELNSQGSAISRLIILLMMTGGPDPGVAADVSLGQPVTQLLPLFFVTLLFFFSTSLCWSSHGFWCAWSTFCQPPAFQCISLLLISWCPSFFLFSCFTNWVFFLSPVLPALSRQWLNPQIHSMPNSKCDLDKFAALLFPQQKQTVFPVLLNRCWLQLVLFSSSFFQETIPWRTASPWKLGHDDHVV